MHNHHVTFRRIDVREGSCIWSKNKKKKTNQIYIEFYEKLSTIDRATRSEVGIEAQERARGAGGGSGGRHVTIFFLPSIRYIRIHTYKCIYTSYVSTYVSTYVSIYIHENLETISNETLEWRTLLEHLINAQRVPIIYEVMHVCIHVIDPRP